MGQAEVKCPHCGKMKFKIKTTEKKNKAGELCQDIEIKKGKWHPVFTQTSPTEWIESWKLGVGVKCKCEKTFFLYNLNDVSTIEVQTNLKENLQYAAFCVPCRVSFLSDDLICPTCGTRC